MIIDSHEHWHYRNVVKVQVCDTTGNILKHKMHGWRNFADYVRYVSFMYKFYVNI